MELLQESAERFGVDLNAIKDDCSITPYEVSADPADEEVMCLAAKVYAERAGGVLDALQDLFEQWQALEPSHEGEQVITPENWREARDVIAWYQHLIYIRLNRARGETVPDTVF
jgi:hypothetical protein